MLFHFANCINLDISLYGKIILYERRWILERERVRENFIEGVVVDIDPIL